MKRQIRLFTAAGILTYLLTACSHGPFDQYRMNGWGHMMDGEGGIMWIFLIILLIVVVCGGSVIFKKIGQQESAISILKERYAKGKISKEEYENMKRDIEG